MTGKPNWAIVRPVLLAPVVLLFVPLFIITMICGTVSFWRVFNTVARSGWPMVGLIGLAVIMGFVCLYVEGARKVARWTLYAALWAYFAAMLISTILCFAEWVGGFERWFIDGHGVPATIITLLVLAIFGIVISRMRQ